MSKAFIQIEADSKKRTRCFVEQKQYRCFKPCSASAACNNMFTFASVSAYAAASVCLAVLAERCYDIIRPSFADHVEILNILSQAAAVSSLPGKCSVG